MKNVSFEVKKGDTLGLIGLNGSGKSTILIDHCRDTEADAGNSKSKRKDCAVN